MRQLHFVALTEDGGQLLVATSEADEQFTLQVDPALRAAIGAEAPRRPSPTRPTEPASSTDPVDGEPAITPREIQVRVRAGESPQDLAATYGLSIERVMRFAEAALDERKRIAGEARRARARRTGPDGTENRIVLFGEAVDERFRAHGIAPDTVTWDARRRDDGEWLVLASWFGGADTHAAEWLFSRTSRTVAPLDDAASDLLSDRPIRPVVPAEPPKPSLVAAPPLVPGIVSFPPMPDAVTGPVPHVEDVFDQEEPPEGPRAVPPLVPAAAELDYDAPPLPLGITDPTTRPAAAEGGLIRNLGVSRRDETEEERAARARVPSWDDILLGIKRRD